MSEQYIPIYDTTPVTARILKYYLQLNGFNVTPLNISDNDNTVITARVLGQYLSAYGTTTISNIDHTIVTALSLKNYLNNLNGQSASQIIQTPKWYVSPTGNSGNAGTLASPWDLASAATGHSGSIKPGDVIAMRGGTYTFTDAGLNITVNGVVGSGADAPDGKIIFQAHRTTLSDPSTMERVIVSQVNNPTAPTSGALSCGATTSGATALQVTKAAGVNQPVSVGQQLTVASGPGAGVYIITAATTIVASSTTAVSVTPNIRGTITGGTGLTINLGPVTNINDMFVMNGSFVWIRDIEIACSLPLRTFQVGGPTAWQNFNQTTDGLKLINCIAHDFSGGTFNERTSGRHEIYGNITYNIGYAQYPTGDGGGHNHYIHHNNGSAKRMSLEANVMFNDYGVAMQMYDSLGSSGAEQNIDYINNVSFNCGQLSTAANIGGKDSQVYIIGGAQEVSSISCRGNIIFENDGNGDVAFQVAQGGQLIGTTIELLNNYIYISGTGFGAIRVAGTIDVAGGGSLRVQGNTLRIWRSDATHNGRAYAIAQNGGTGYIWGGSSPNTIYRTLGAGGNACGADGSSPFVAADVTGGCRTLAQFLSDCGFSGDTVSTSDPANTYTFVIKADKYEAGRGWIGYINYANLTSIPIDVSSILNVGDVYEIHDVRAAYATATAISSGTYAGGTVTVPNTQLSDPAVSGAQVGIGFEQNPPAVAPKFNIFRIRKLH